MPSAVVNLNSGSFSTTISGSGNAHLTGASGNYRTWSSLGFLGWLSTNTGLSASDQSPAISMSNINISNPASGTADIGYDNVTPGTPTALNSLTADLDSNNTNYGFTINIGALTVNAGILGDLDLTLTVHGTITDATFTSTGTSSATPTMALTVNLT